MRAVYTNVIVRYLTGDHPEQSGRARAIIDGGRTFVSLTVLLESEWVLRSVYGIGKRETIRALRAFCGLPGVSIGQPATAASALVLAERRIELADAIHLAQGAQAGLPFLTFDRQLVRAANRAGHHAVEDA